MTVFLVQFILFLLSLLGFNFTTMFLTLKQALHVNNFIDADKIQFLATTVR